MPRPLPANTTISVYSSANLVDPSGNPVTLYSDYACWVEATQSFVAPENCNLMKNEDE
jgi:hypothetical protein